MAPSIINEKVKKTCCSIDFRALQQLKDDEQQKGVILIIQRFPTSYCSFYIIDTIDMLIPRYLQLLKFPFSFSNSFSSQKVSKSGVINKTKIINWKNQQK